MRTRNSAISETALTVYRYGRWAGSLPKPARTVADLIYHLLNLVIVKLLIGADIPRGAVLGRDLILEHGAKGVVIGDNAIVGDRVTVYHQVTIARRAVIGDDVFISPGAKILHHVTVGNNVKIGANAVVVRDVPSNSTAVGVPARVLPRAEGHVQELLTPEEDGPGPE